MKILVINAGSSSLKYQLIDMETEHLLAKGLCERIRSRGSEERCSRCKSDGYAPRHLQGSQGCC